MLKEYAMTGRLGLALVAGALLVSLFIVFGPSRLMSAQDLFPTPEGRLGGRMPLPTAEILPSDSPPQDTPAASGHSLAGAWLLTFSEPDQAPAQAVLGDDGIVTFIDADGNRGAGVWMPNGQQGGVLVIVVHGADTPDRPHGVTILRGPIEVETSGDAVTLNFSYTVETVDESAAASEPAGPFTATGQRATEQLIVPTPD
jgi:hypothetical protein